MTKISNTPQATNPVFKQELFDDFKRLANCSQDGIYHYDIDSRRFLFYNQKFRIFFRLDDQAEINISSDHIVTSMHPEDRQQALKALNESLSAGHTEGEAEYRVLYSDGAIRWLHDRWIVIRNPQGKPLAVQGFIRDNTQRKLAELQFIESTQNALIGSYIVQEGKFQYVNPKFISITGYTEAELIGKNSMAIVREDYREHVRQCAVAMLKGESLTPYEFCVLDKSGSTHRVMETVTSVIYRGKRAVLGYFMDITQLHQMKDNLSTLGLMLGTISHSLRGCLTGLNASLYLIETGFYRNRPAQIEEGLDVTKLMADRIRKLVLDILYYSKDRDLEIEEVEVWRFAKDVALQMERRIKAANIEFISDFPPDSGNFTIDPEIIRTALTNILENAMEACIEDARDIPHWIRFATRADAANVYFEISDNGPGMDKEMASKIFQLFSSSKGKRGTGIGLFVTRKVILKHGGTITVDSSPNQGASFRITLPRKPHVAS
ncbi:MAG: PAS domain S-box protein [Deltaproteobacteria bacterium]|jgi:PAS domain S-box-containing protein|nr:PAS domain S-box protein [Deltaproteobacteria bacterium]